MSRAIWAMSFVGAVASAVALVVFVTGRQSLPELLGVESKLEPLATADGAAGGASAGSVAATPAGASSAAEPPCVRVAKLGFRCSGDSLLEAVQANNREAISLIVAGGVDGMVPVKTEWNGTASVLKFAQDGDAPGTGLLVKEMLDRSLIDPCVAMAIAVDEPAKPVDQCAILSASSCRAKFATEVKAQASEEARIIDADYAALSKQSSCVAHYMADNARFYSQGDVEYPRCSISSRDYSNCFAGAISSGQVQGSGASCNEQVQNKLRGCYVRECERFSPELKAKYPAAKDFRLAVGSRARRLQVYEDMLVSCR